MWVVEVRKIDHPKDFKTKNTTGWHIPKRNMPNRSVEVQTASNLVSNGLIVLKSIYHQKGGRTYPLCSVPDCYCYKREGTQLFFGIKEKAPDCYRYKKRYPTVIVIKEKVPVCYCYKREGT